MKSIIQETAELIKENAEKLQQCSKPHDFKKIMGLSPEESLHLANKCRKCGGKLPNEMARWYILGLVHAVNQKIKAEEILHLEDCPNPGCGNQGQYPVDDGDGYPIPEQCEWCWTHPKSKFRENDCQPL